MSTTSLLTSSQTSMKMRRLVVNEQLAAMEAEAVKAILLDLDNTLIETSRAGRSAITKTRELLKATLALDDGTIGSVCDQFQRKLHQETFDPSAGRSIDEVRVGHWEESIQEAVGGASPPALAARCYYLWKTSRLEALSLSAAVRDLLKRLRAGGYKLLLLTNGEARTQREKVEAVGCEEFFDAIVIGGEHAEQKPFVSIFALCFERLQVEARHCVMVGDSLDTDIQGGVNAKVRATVWIGDGARPDGSVAPDYTIATVLELPHVLQLLTEN